MDKVKVVLALLKKHHFWVMTGMVVLLSFIGWFLATSQLWAAYRAERDKIEAKFKALNTISSGERENQNWIDALEKQTGVLKEKVRTAWSDIYAKQKKEVFIWPKVGTVKNQAKLEKLGPKDPIEPNIRRAYHTYIRDEFARLLKIVDARDEHGGKERKGAPEAAEAPTHDYMVTWDAKNQQDIYAKFTSWLSTPTSEEVRVTQEDLWVYHALLKIIADLNQNATAPYNAKVKEIESLLIGSEAAERFKENMAEGRLERPAGAPPLPPGPGLQAAASSTPSATTSATLGRYVDDKGMPFSDPSTMPAEFKRMPIVMRLIMDQREILRLLIGCANSTLPVEVRHLHVHPRRTSKPGEAQRAAEKELVSYDMDVELDGVIYIFNPPDQTKLGEVAAPDGGAPAAEPPSPNPNGGKPDAGAPPAVDAPRAAAEIENQPAPAAAGKGAGEPAAPAEPADMEKTNE